MRSVSYTHLDVYKRQRIGRDMIGTMSNTLILAFAGEAVTTLLLLMAYGWHSRDVYKRQLFINGKRICKKKGQEMVLPLLCRR